MSEKKTIQFNPDFLKFSNNKTRKNRAADSSSSGGIKLKQTKKKDETFKKNSILKMIRKHQQEKYNKMLESFETPKEKRPSQNLQTSTTEFKSDFEDSKQFMDRLVEETALKQNIHNSTLRRHTPLSGNSDSLLFDLPLENILELPPSLDDNPMRIQQTAVAKSLAEQPRFGCLKNGSLPTYRNWLNQTQKNFTQQGAAIDTVRQKPAQHRPQSDIGNEMAKRMDRIAQRQPAKKRAKQKRVVRRTFKIGKSTVIPKIAVLVSNRSIRNKVSTDGQLLKQKPMEEIKRYLIKRGLIRVGTSAPNDVLRKMFECSALMCGEVQNHNPDNLLYNFLNSDDN